MAEENPEKKSSGSGRKKNAGAGTKGPKSASPVTVKESTVEDTELLAHESAESNEEILGDRFWRFIAMIVFARLAYFALLPFVILAAMQFGVVLMTGEKNVEVHQLLSRLARYIKECLDYVAYRSDRMPFPFGPFPPAD